MGADAIQKRLDVSDPRYWRQNAQWAIRDIYDAITELVTNADDAYTRLGGAGRIDIEIERHHGATSPVLRVRDFATGMSHEDMQEKLAKLGSRRHSGFANGAPVRGTNSRGAKDVAILGTVTFESIASGDTYASCRITPQGDFTSPAAPAPATADVRQRLGIPEGTGTLVTLEIDPTTRRRPTIQQHDTMAEKVRTLVPLRRLLSDPERDVWLHDSNKQRHLPIRYHPPKGTERVKEQLRIPGYPEAQAKLIIKRAKQPLNGGARPKFRESGILVMSKRAVHESTFFAPELERDSHAQRFFGTLKCDYIDDLWNDYDERFERREPPDTERNPWGILDQHRQTGLRKDHPFVEALFEQALRHLRRVVEEEHRREESERIQVESQQTRRRLNALERLATEFMQRFHQQEDETTQPVTTKIEGALRRKGFCLSPPYSKILLGHRQRFWLDISETAYPQITAGSTVRIECDTDDISTSKNSVQLQPHPDRDNTLRAGWEVRGTRVTRATAVTGRADPIVATASVKVLESERDSYADIAQLCFQHKVYNVVPRRPKRVRLLAPYSGSPADPRPVELTCDTPHVRIPRNPTLRPRENLGIADCYLRVTMPDPDMKARLIAVVGEERAETQLVSRPPAGEPITISIQPVDLGNQRSRWRGNTLEIAAFHPSVCRYLGKESEKFPGQEKTQFRVLLAEIVAYAVCERLLDRNVADNPDEYQDYDLNAFLAERDRLVTEFLPAAHQNQVPRPD